MNKLIDKITIEVENHPIQSNVRYITLLFKGNIVADTACYIGDMEDRPYASIFNLNLVIAIYLSLSRADIIKIIEQFILDVGLGIGVVDIDMGYYE